MKKDVILGTIALIGTMSAYFCVGFANLRVAPQEDLQNIGVEQVSETFADVLTCEYSIGDYVTLAPENLHVRFSDDQVNSMVCEDTSTNIHYDLPLTDEQQDVIYTVCEKYNIEPSLIFAMAMVETTCNPDAIGDHGDSFGLLQIQPKWWGYIYEELGCTSYLSVFDNVSIACVILNHFKAEYGTDDTRTLLNAWNTGNPNNHNGYADKVFNELGELRER